MIQKKKFRDAIAANISVVGELLPIIKKTTNSAGVLKSSSGVGLCIAYDSKNQSNYCCVSFGTNPGNSIRVEKLSGNLEVGGTYNNQGTWLCDGADSYVVVSV